MRRIGGYHPHWRAQKAIEDFEESIGVMIRFWLREKAQEGYSVASLATAIGITDRQTEKLLAHYNIKTTGSYRPLYKDAVNIRAYVTQRGGDRRIEERMRRRIAAGMTLAQAWRSAQTSSMGKKITASGSKQ
jgi:hypothetical protein